MEGMTMQESRIYGTDPSREAESGKIPWQLIVLVLVITLGVIGIVIKSVLGL
jgi:hypothetical protein